MILRNTQLAGESFGRREHRTVDLVKLSFKVFGFTSTIKYSLINNFLFWESHGSIIRTLCILISSDNRDSTIFCWNCKNVSLILLWTCMASKNRSIKRLDEKKEYNKIYFKKLHNICDNMVIISHHITKQIFHYWFLSFMEHDYVINTVCTVHGQSKSEKNIKIKSRIHASSQILRKI